MAKRNIYLSLFIYNALEIIYAYPLSILIQIFKRILETYFLVLFWSLVASSGTTDFKSIISYFLIAGGITEITLSSRIPLGVQIRRAINVGELTNYLIKPINVVFSYIAMIYGSKTILLIFSFLNIVLGVIINPKLQILSIIWFIPSLMLATCISISLNLFFATICLHIRSVGGFNQLYGQIIKILAGGMIPIYLFAEPIKNILQILPFSYAIYFPIQILTETLSFEKIRNGFLISIFWSFLLIYLSFKYWNYSLKKYESYGI